VRSRPGDHDNDQHHGADHGDTDQHHGAEHRDTDQHHGADHGADDDDPPRRARLGPGAGLQSQITGATVSAAGTVVVTFPPTRLACR
jgi:hypothetical protein